MNRDVFSLQKDLIYMYSDPAVQEYRDAFMYDHIYNSAFRNNITFYSYNDQGIIIKVNKIPGQDSSGIIADLEVIFSQFVLSAIDRFHDKYGSYVCRDIYTPGTIHYQSLGELAFNCCHILDITPPNSNEFVISLKYFN